MSRSATVAVDPLRRGVVRILSEDGAAAGTGFLTAGGLIVSCAHVVEGDRNGPRLGSVDVEFDNGERVRARIDESSLRHDGVDIVVLVPEAGIDPSRQLHLGTSHDVEGRDLRAFGFPYLNQKEGLAAECHVLRGATTLGGVPVFAMRSHEVTRGFSGAPVWDDQLRAVVGMIVAFVAPGEVAVGDRTVLVPSDPGGRQTETAYMISTELIRRCHPGLRLPAGNPYRRLDFFGPAHVDYYFGRERATDELLFKLIERDFVALVGTSGSGKSSLVRAGLAKGLAQNQIPGLAERVRWLVTPGPSPLMDLALALRDFTGQARDDLGKTLDSMSPTEIADAIQTIAHARGALLIVDQFERLYTECQDEDVRAAFVDVLIATASDTVKVLLVLRADFYGRVLRHLELSKVVKTGQVTVLPMDEDELRSAIEKPALVLKRSFQPSLVDALIADVSGQAGGLPLLEFTLAELWANSAGEAVITHASYETLGFSVPGASGGRYHGVSGAIARAAESVWQALDRQERDLVPLVFRALVTQEMLVGQDGRTGRYASRRAWQAEWDDDARRVAERFVAARLLVTRTDAVTHQPVFELAHEALIEAWPALRKWLAESSKFNQWYVRDLAPAFRDWIDRDRNPEYLLRDSLLAPAQDWVRVYPEGLSAPLREYIDLSVAAYERRRADERARREELERALRNEQEQRRLAQRGTEEANALLWATRARQEEDDSLAVALALEANLISSPPAFAQQVLAEIAYRPGARRLLEFGHQQRVWCVARHEDIAVSGGEGGDLFIWDLAGEQPPRRLAGHVGDVWSVALGADGRICVSGGADRRVIAWDTATGRIIQRLDGHDGAVHAVAISNDRVLSGSSDRDVILWDIATGRVIHRMRDHTDVVAGVALSRDGRTAVSASSDHSVIVWDVVSGELRHRLVGHAGSVWDVALSGDGRTAVSGSSDRSVIVWDVTTGELLHRFVGHAGAVTGVVADLTGAQHLSCGDDRSLIIWDAGAGEPVRRLRGHGAVPVGVALSADGRTALSAALDGTLIVWDTGTGYPVRHLHGHGAVPVGVALSADGRTALSTATDGALTLWDTRTGQTVDADIGAAAGTAVALSGDGRTVLIGTADGDLILADLRGEQLSRQIRDSTAISRVAMDADGAAALASTVDGQLIFWDVTGDQVQDARDVLDMGKTVATGVAFSGDARNLAVGGADGSLTLWDGATETVHRVVGHTAAVRAVALSADGTTALTAGDDQRLVVWNTTRSALLRRIPAHTKAVTSIALSRDGRTALSGSDDTNIALWDLETGERITSWPLFEANGVALNADGTTAIAVFDVLSLYCWDTRTSAPPRRLSGHTEAVKCVALSADGRTAISGGVDHRVLLWNTADAELARSFHGHTGPVRSIGLAPDGTVAATGSDDRSVTVWDTHTGAVLRRLDEHRDAVTGIAFSPSGQTIASSSADGALFVGPVRDGNRNAFVGHRTAVTGMAFTPDGTTLLSVGADGTVIVWDVATSQPIRLLGSPGTRARCLSCTVDRRGSVVAVGAEDGTIAFWRIHSPGELLAWTHANRLVRELRCEEREAHHLPQLCDEYGNPPDVASWPVLPEPLTSLTIGPPPNVSTPRMPTDLPLEPEVEQFDAVQEGRTRTWRFSGQQGETATILVTPGGIDLEPHVELHGPGRPAADVRDEITTRRVRLGPVTLPATGTYQVVVSGRGTSAGGYTIRRLQSS